MGIGKIMARAAGYFTNAGNHSAKRVTKTVQQVVNANAKNTTPSILSKIESNTAGRILRMQDAKAVFTPVAPYATKVTKESVPTLQKINEITGVSRGAVKDATGYFDKKACADALAAFKHEPVKIQGGKLGVTSKPTQQYLDNMLGIAKTDALKAYEEGGRATKEILEARTAAREAFTKGGDVTPRWQLKYNKNLKNIVPKFTEGEFFKKAKLASLPLDEASMAKFKDVNLKYFDLSKYDKKKLV